MNAQSISITLPFLAFASDAADVETLKQFAAAHGWADSCIQQGDIRTATAFLKENPSPGMLLVEVPSASEAPALLDGLAEVCSGETKVIVMGAINEYSFFCWLQEIGIFSYLLRPLTAQMLETTYAKAVERPAAPGHAAKAPAKVIAVIGARGGVGASTLALNLAGIIADQSRKNVALIDLDPYESTLSLTLDIEPSRGFREALEKPDRIDSLFIERVMAKPIKHLSVLSAEESLQDNIIVHDQASEMLLKEMRDKFDVLVLDVPRHLNAFTGGCLAKAEQVVLVAELTLPSLRDTLRLSDQMREMFKLKPPMIVINRKGMTKHDLKPADFEKGVGGTIAHSVPFAADLFMPVGTEIPALKIKTHAAAKVLQQIAGDLVPEAKGGIKDAGGKEAKKSGGMFKKKKDGEAEEKKEG